MDIAYLRRKGWSEGEIRHALQVFKQAQLRKHPWINHAEHALLWALLLGLLSGAVGASVALLPLIVLGTPAYVIPVSFLIGSMLGLLLVHALRDLQPAPHRHLAGFSILSLACAGIVTVVLVLLEQRLGGVSPWFVSLPLIIGMAVPYAAHWRDHGPA